MPQAPDDERTLTPTVAAARTIELLRTLATAGDEPRRLGEQAARLWWLLDEAGTTDALPPGHEEALLQIAALHTGDRRLRAQALSPGEAEQLLSELTRERPDPPEVRGPV